MNPIKIGGTKEPAKAKRKKAARLAAEAGLTDRAEALARGRVGAVVHAGDAGAEGDREGRARVGDLHRVHDDRLEVALRLGGALERGELPLPAQ